MWNYCAVSIWLFCINVWGSDWMSETVTPLVVCMSRAMKSEKDSVVQKFQTWSNDLKWREPAGLRGLPCVPYLPLLSFQCPETHLDSHLCWKWVDRTALAPASCAAGCSFVLLPIQEKPFVQSLSHMGIFSGQEPEARWNSGLRSPEDRDHGKAKRQADLMAIWKYEHQPWQQWAGRILKECEWLLHQLRWACFFCL